MAVECMPAYKAFEEQLSTLCLHEFPCGLGSWRERKAVKETQLKNLPPQLIKKTTVKLVPVTSAADSQFSNTLKDYGCYYEKTEVLEEYVKSIKSPWSLDYSWSNEARELRELAVKSPWLINERFIVTFFKTLKIIDKNVTDVDPYLLKFKNLEELSLAANLIKAVNSRNLPQSLKVLELCANEISDLSSLCIKAPPLIHLGLGYNVIYSIDDYITGSIWPNLLSLDLGSNNLSDLMDIVRKLSTVTTLRNLILQGNPLALIPGYRGYIIDSLRKLTILDDIRISADEKHLFKGLAKKKEYILDEAKIRFSVKDIVGLPMPEEIKNPDEQPEFPIITRKYCVQFMFLEDVSAKAETLNLLEDIDNSNSYIQETDRTETRKYEETPAETPQQEQLTDRSDIDSIRDEMVSVSDQRSANLGYSTEPPPSIPPTIQENEILELPLEEDLGEASQQQHNSTYRLEPLKSEAAPWGAEIELNWWKTVTRDNLLGLRDFFRDGLEISLVEEKILSYPADQTNDEVSSRSGSAAKKKTDKKKDDKGKDTKGGKDEKKDDGKKKKKKGEPEVELKHMPPVYTKLATFHLELSEFLDGEYEKEERFSYGGLTEDVTLDLTDGGKADGKKDKGKDKKKPSSGKKDPAKDRRSPKSPKGDKKDDKKGKAKDTKITNDEDEEQGPPPPLEISVGVKLFHWQTAADSMKVEQDKSCVEDTATPE